MMIKLNTAKCYVVDIVIICFCGTLIVPNITDNNSINRHYSHNI